MGQAIAIDFDGVIHKYSKGWNGGEIYDEPIEGAFDAIKKLMKRGYSVFILSTRSSAQIRDWCDEQSTNLKFEVIPHKTQFWNKKDVVGITQKKIAATAYIDDRGLRFTNWPDMVKYFG